MVVVSTVDVHPSADTTAFPVCVCTVGLPTCVVAPGVSVCCVDVAVPLLAPLVFLFVDTVLVF